MGLSGSQASNNKKTVMNYEQLLRAVFSCFHGQKIEFLIFFLHFRVCTKKLLDTKVKLKKKKLGSILWGLKTGFFRASCFGYRVKGVCPLLLPLVSLLSTDFKFEVKNHLIE
jgi:hypothetical protein